MSGWDKTRAIEWFTRRVGKRVAVRQVGTPLRVRGVLRAMSEIDACSADYFTAAIDTGLAGMQVDVSFHDEGVSVQIMAGQTAAASPDVFLPVSVPYTRLDLAETGAETGADAEAATPVATPPAAAAEESAPVVYPYELIR